MLYSFYKSSTHEFKRTVADRSIDSDLEADPKKAHMNDSSTSTMNDHEEGEVAEQKPSISHIQNSIKKNREKNQN